MNLATTLNIIKFIGTKNPDYQMDKIEKYLTIYPAHSGSTTDENGLQGSWVHRDKVDDEEDGDNEMDGNYTIVKYKNNNPISAEHYWDDKLYNIGFYKLKNGDISPFNKNNDGKAHGYWEIYNGKNRAMIDKGHYVDGKKNGKWEGFYPNGNIHYKENYINDKLDGECVYFHENGKLKNKITYEDGEKNGLDVQYHENGVTKSEGEYLKDTKVGHWIYRYDDGQLEKSITFIRKKNGEEAKTGEYIEYFPDGKIKKDCYYDDNGKLIKDFVEYHPNGQIFYKGQYDGNGPWGIFTQYNLDGKITHETIYEKYKKKRQRGFDANGELKYDEVFDITNGGVEKYSASYMKQYYPSWYDKFPKFPDEK